MTKTSKTYYKVLRTDLTHHGFTYAKGLNVDTVPFHPKGTCSAGGFYFSDLKNIARFTMYGDLIAEVTLPDDAQVYQEPYKWKADKIVLNNIVPLDTWYMWCNLDFQFMAIQADYNALRFIHEPCEAVQLAAVRLSGPIIVVITNPSEAVQLAAVRQTGWALAYIDDPSEVVQIAAVRQAGHAFKYIKNPSEAVQLVAVRKNAWLLKDIKNPSEAVQIAAVQQNARVLKDIKNPSDAVQIAAVQYSVSAITYIDNPSEAVRRANVNVHQVRRSGRKRKSREFYVPEGKRARN